MADATNKEFKLNYKRTLIIGFAFFGILLLWQVYDTWCPPLLTELFKKALNTDSEHVQYIVGIVMAMDNLAALLIMPLFGRLSDKTHTRIGKRMPYILVGTMVCAIAFPFIPIFFHYNNIVGTIIMMGIVLVFAMMYRNPAVSLMPDMTPKPLRSKANGLINIMGYLGGAFATVVGIVFVLSHYLGVKYDGPQVGQLWVIEMPFVIASFLMVASAAVLFFLVKENKIAEEVKDEMARGELVAESAEKLSEDDEAPLSRANRIMLFLILGAEFFWFMADNGVSTFLSNYIIYNVGASTVSTAILTIVGGVGSVVGFIFGGIIASKIGRKWTLLSGLFLTIAAYALWAIFTYTLGLDVDVGFANTGLPFWLYLLWLFKGFGMSLVHVNSYPMVVELCTGKKIGQFTGYYYAASMAAQSVTPIAFGALLLAPAFDWNLLPIYAGVCIAISIAVFIFVKNVKTRKTSIKVGLEALDQED